MKREILTEGTTENVEKKVMNLSPTVGLSNGVKDMIQQLLKELYFSDLKTDNIWVEEEGDGIPFLKSLLILKINNSQTPSINLITEKYEIDESNDISVDGDITKIKLTFDDKNLTDETSSDSVYETSYVEDNYYVKILNLGRCEY